MQNVFTELQGQVWERARKCCICMTDEVLKERRGTTWLKNVLQNQEGSKNKLGMSSCQEYT